MFGPYEPLQADSPTLLCPVLLHVSDLPSSHKMIHLPQIEPDLVTKNPMPPTIVFKRLSQTQLL